MTEVDFSPLCRCGHYCYEHEMQFGDEPVRVGCKKCGCHLYRFVPIESRLAKAIRDSVSPFGEFCTFCHSGARGQNEYGLCDACIIVFAKLNVSNEIKEICDKIVKEVK